MTRAQIQSEATKNIIDNKFNTIMFLSPRVGKTKLCIDALRKLDNTENILIIAPYNTILESWKSEFNKWKFNFKGDLLNQRSLDKIKRIINSYDIIICDEIHSLSDAQLRILKTSKAAKLGLSGTISKDTLKRLKTVLKLDLGYSYSIEQAIQDGLVSNYKINIVTLPLDNQKKYVSGGTKKKPFKTTEKQNYDYLTKMVRRFMIISQKTNNPVIVKAWLGKRMRAVYSYQSKIDLTKKLIQKYKDQKKLVFTTLTTNDLTKYSYHSKSKGDELDMFVNDEISELTVVQMVSMGKLICPCK